MYKIILVFVLFLVSCTPKLDSLEDQFFNKIENGKIITSKNKAVSLTTDEDATIIYLVRHAEKQDNGKDPELTKAGRERAEKLSMLLKSTKIDEIFSTDYLRTKQTLESIANDKGLSITIYNPNDLTSFAQMLKRDFIGKKLVVSGHSNTTANLVNLLVGDSVYENINEDEYAFFFIVILSKDKAAKVIRLKY